MAGNDDRGLDDGNAPDASESLRRLERHLMGGERLHGVTMTDVERLIALLRRTPLQRLAA